MCDGKATCGSDISPRTAVSILLPVIFIAPGGSRDFWLLFSWSEISVLYYGLRGSDVLYHVSCCGSKEVGCRILVLDMGSWKESLLQIYIAYC
jgi:hypothetical protein